MRGLLTARSAFGLAIAIATVSTLVGAQAAAAGYVYQPAPGVICTGGDTTGPTIGQWLRSVQPKTYALLPTAAQNLVDNVFNGTTCTQRGLAGPGLVSPAPIPVRGSAGGASVFGLTAQGVNADEDVGVMDSHGDVTTSPLFACSPPTGGCVTATAIFSNTFTFGTFNYFADVEIELDAYDGATGSWAPNATNFHNNHGSSWGMSISRTPINWGDHIGYNITASGSGSFTWLVADPAQSEANFFGEQVHMGSQATLTVTFPDGSQGTGTYCWFGDFVAYNGAVLGGGWCASP